MNLICAIDEQFGIGKDGKLLQRIPDDLKHFKTLTENKIVIMGKTTFESLPNGPLENRVNIVLTRDKKFKNKDIIICNSVDEVIKKTNNLKDDKFIIGGGQIYKEFLPYCDRAYITKIFDVYDADTFMVNLDNESDWVIESWGEVKRWRNVQYQYYTYVRKNLLLKMWF